MEGALDPVATWLGEAAEGIPVIDEASVALVRERVRSEAVRAGLGDIPTASLVNVASELAHNQRIHARSGVVVVRPVQRGEQRGLEVVAGDRGAGIVDVARALEGKPSTAGSLGVGLAAVLELADEVDIDVRLREGTCVWARKFDGPAPQRPRVGVFGRPYPGEPCSGDDAAFVRAGDALLVGVVDGLAMARWLARLRCGRRACSPTVACCARAGPRRVRWAARAHPRGGHGCRTPRQGGRGFGGRRGQRRRTRVWARSLVALRRLVVRPRLARGRATHRRRETLGQARDILILFSDGIRSKLDLTGELDLLREHPAVIAQRVVERFARDDDDVLVMVVG